MTIMLAQKIKKRRYSLEINLGIYGKQYITKCKKGNI